MPHNNNNSISTRRAGYTAIPDSSSESSRHFLSIQIKKKPFLYANHLKNIFIGALTLAYFIADVATGGALSASLIAIIATAAAGLAGSIFGAANILHSIRSEEWQHLHHKEKISEIFHVVLDLTLDVILTIMQFALPVAELLFELLDVLNKSISVTMAAESSRDIALAAQPDLCFTRNDLIATARKHHLSKEKIAALITLQELNLEKQERTPLATAKKMSSYGSTSSTPDTSTSTPTPASPMQYATNSMGQMTPASFPSEFSMDTFAKSVDEQYSLN